MKESIKLTMCLCFILLWIDISLCNFSKFFGFCREALLTAFNAYTFESCVTSTQRANPPSPSNFPQTYSLDSPVWRFTSYTTHPGRSVGFVLFCVSWSIRKQTTTKIKMCTYLRLMCLKRGEILFFLRPSLSITNKYEKRSESLKQYSNAKKYISSGITLICCVFSRWKFSFTRSSVKDT